MAQPPFSSRASHGRAEALATLNAAGAEKGPHWAASTGPVFGEGPLDAALALIGEQPGDKEDEEGRPFVGPAGRLLDRALEEAGIARKDCYLTNAVKHFKFVQRGKRRIHQKPGAGDVAYYRWWLEAELDLVAPRRVVTLVATALLALSGKPLAISRLRGLARLQGRETFVTVHPSSILRAPNADRAGAYAGLLADLRAARDLSAADLPPASAR